MLLIHHFEKILWMSKILQKIKTLESFQSMFPPNLIACKRRRKISIVFFRRKFISPKKNSPMKRWKVNQNLFSNTLKSKTTAKTKKFCLDGAEPSGVGRKVGRIRPDQVAWQPEGNKTSLSGQTCFHGELDCQLQHFEFGHIFEQIGPKSNSGKKSGADDGEKLVFSATLV